MRTTLIITTYNWPAALALVLQSVARQTAPPFEIIVADDGSSPDTAALIDSWKARMSVPLIHLWQEDRGFRLARVRNRAIAAARGDYIILVDGDMVLHRHFVADHVRAARPGAFVQGVRLITRRATAERMLQRNQLDLHFLSPGIERRRHTIRNILLSRLVFFERQGQRAIRGCNQAYWRYDLLHVNGFNEEMTGWGREDNEIAARLYNAGLRRRNLKFQALATHLFHPARQPAGINPNDVLLRESIERGRTWCPLGLAQHLT